MQPHNHSGNTYQSSHRDAYEADCATIHSIVSSYISQALPRPAHADKSPDLASVYHDSLEALQRLGKPEARWLQYSTWTGFFLWNVLVGIMMRRVLEEDYAGLVGTMGWRGFLGRIDGVRGQVLEEVCKE